MTWWPYVAGTATPTENPGLAEVSGLRLVNDGTFRPLAIPPLTQTPPLRITSHAAPFDDGGLVTEPKYDIWQFNITGWFLVDTAAQVQPAIDYLFTKVNRDLGWQTWSFRGVGWGAAKTLSCRVAGQVVVVDMEQGDANIVTRGLTIPLIAANPVLA